MPFQIGDQGLAVLARNGGRQVALDAFPANLGFRACKGECGIEEGDGLLSKEPGLGFLLGGLGESRFHWAEADDEKGNEDGCNFHFATGS